MKQLMGTIGALTLAGALASCGPGAPPPGVTPETAFLQTHVFTLALGHSTRADLVKALGAPDSTEAVAQGEGSFRWSNLTADHYQAWGLDVVTSKTLDRVVQVVYHPPKDTTFNTVAGITQASTPDQVRQAAEAAGLLVQDDGPQVLWVTVADHAGPAFRVLAGFSWSEGGRLETVHLQIDADWTAQE